MEEFSNRIENVIESKLDLAIKTTTEELLNEVEQKHNKSEQQVQELKGQEPAAAEGTSTNLNPIELSSGKLVKRVEETKLNREKPSKPRNTKGRYINWTAKHEHLRGDSYISIPELNNIISKLSSAKDDTEISKELSNVVMSLKTQTAKNIYTVRPTVRFPNGEFIALSLVRMCLNDKEYGISFPEPKNCINLLRELAITRYQRITAKSFENSHNLHWSYDD